MSATLYSTTEMKENELFVFKNYYNDPKQENCVFLMKMGPPIFIFQKRQKKKKKKKKNWVGWFKVGR